MIQKFGWAGPKESVPALEKAKAAGLYYDWIDVKSSNLRSSEGERVALFDAVKKVTGDYLPNIAQEIGDCVSWGCRNAADTLACVEIARLGDNEEFHPSFAPYFYGISRVQIGGGRLGNQDGSLGIWAADGVKKYGVLQTDHAKASGYQGSVAKEWGREGPPQWAIESGKQHLIRAVARIRSYEELRDALANGYPCTIASMKGFNMQMAFDQRTNKHWYTGQDQWPHQMALLAVDDDPRRPGVFRINSWGPNAHGPQKDGPPGGGWQDAEDIDRELRDRSTECFAFSQFDGFPAQAIDYVWI